MIISPSPQKEENEKRKKKKGIKIGQNKFLYIYKLVVLVQLKAFHNSLGSIYIRCKMLKINYPSKGGTTSMASHVKNQFWTIV
jgi:hypothetical protein